MEQAKKNKTSPKKIQLDENNIFEPDGGRGETGGSQVFSLHNKNTGARKDRYLDYVSDKEIDMNFDYTADLPEEKK